MIVWRFSRLSILSLQLLLVFSNVRVLAHITWIPPTSSYTRVSVAGSVSTYVSDPAKGWIRFFARPEEWAEGWCVFTVPPMGSDEFLFDPPPPFNLTLYVARIVNASLVKLDINGSDLSVSGFWEFNYITNPATTYDVLLLTQNMTVASGQLSVAGNWSSFTINLQGFNSIQGNITSYYVGEVQTRPWYGPLFGDVNDDGKIDMRDIGTIARAFGSIFGFNLRYDFRADINFDFKVDMKDIGACARGFGI